MQKKKSNLSFFDILLLRIFLIICPIGVILDICTSFSAWRDSPFIAFIYYAVTICEIIFFCWWQYDSMKKEEEKQERLMREKIYWIGGFC